MSSRPRWDPARGLSMGVELQVWGEARDVIKAQVRPCLRPTHGGGAASVGGGARRSEPCRQYNVWPPLKVISRDVLITNNTFATRPPAC